MQPHAARMKRSASALQKNQPRARQGKLAAGKDCARRIRAYSGQLLERASASRNVTSVSTPVKQWIFAHECGHQFRGPDEETADCFAVQRGRRQGWLTTSGLDEICKFISPAKGDSMHFSGSHRCEAMRQCYADPSIR